MQEVRNNPSVRRCCHRNSCPAPSDQGPFGFLDAAAKVVKKHPNAKFLIGGPDENNLRATLEKEWTSWASKIMCFPRHGRRTVFFFEYIDINVLASYSEAFHVILEGARMKKATVSSRVGGLEDLFIQGENGYLYPPGDSNAWLGIC